MGSAFSEYGILRTLDINKIKFHKIPHSTVCQYKLLLKLHICHNASLPYKSVIYKI